MIVKIAHYVLKFLKEQFKRLEKEQIFVYICHGNHDPLTTRITDNWPNNVSVFSNRVETYQAITKAGEQIYIHGFSYQNNTSYENKIDEYPSSQGSNGIHIGMLHGTYSKSKIKQRYTEFMLEDLNHKLYHYWALGHIHQRQELSDMPPIHYSGNIQGRHFGEIGTKGCLLVEGIIYILKQLLYQLSLYVLKKLQLRLIKFQNKVSMRKFKSLRNKFVNKVKHFID